MPNKPSAPKTLSIDEANALVLEHQGWAESIARSVARAWNLDWKLDGLDGAAMEAIIFCARRFDPSRGVPFRGYARKRIHEASTEAAKKSRGWRKGMSSEDQRAREISAELFNVFPELRSGQLPFSDEGRGEDGDDARGAIRGLLVGASIIAAKQQGLSGLMPDELVDHKRMLELIASLEPVHQLLLWGVYWEGQSMRSVANDWEVDELSVIREHKSVLSFLLKGFEKKNPTTKLKIRPALREVGIKIKKRGEHSPFSHFLQGGPP